MHPASPGKVPWASAGLAAGQDGASQRREEAPLDPADPGRETPPDAAVVPGGAGHDPERARYLAFDLGDQHLAVPLDRVHSVLRPVPVTPVPFTPPTLLGAINIRSELVPLLDLERCLGLEGRPVDPSRRFLVLEHQGLLRAVVVDGLRDVLRAGPEDLEPGLAEGEGEGRGALLVTGVLRAGDELVSVLDEGALEPYLSASSSP